MITSYSDEKRNTKTKVNFICDNCNKEDSRNMKSHFKLLNENFDFDKDYCKKCWNSIRQKTPRAKERMSKAINEMIKRDPEWCKRNSESKKGKINIGENNGMKKPEAREKASISRKKLMSSGYNKNVSTQMKKAWANGKYEGVNVGQSKWHTYNHSNGNEYKVQGTWELAFIQWLDENNMKFECHKGRIPYELNGETKSYYPDFFVYEWDSYVDIKNNYHYSIQRDKFKALEKTKNSIKVILQDELETLINRKL